jgi:WD40 repeat protein
VRVLTASYDKTARVWDAASGATLAILRGHFGEVRSAVFDASGTHVLTASQDSTARVWDAASGAELAVLSGHAAFVASAEFDPTGARILTASEDETARVWDTASGATAMDAIIINPASFCVNAAEDSITFKSHSAVAKTSAFHSLRSYALSGVTSVPTNSLNPKLTAAVTEPSLNAELGCIRVVDTFRFLATIHTVGSLPYSARRTIRRTGRLGSGSVPYDRQ